MSCSSIRSMTFAAPLPASLAFTAGRRGSLALARRPSTADLRRGRIAVGARGCFGLPPPFAYDHAQAFGQTPALDLGRCAVRQPGLHANRSYELALLDPDDSTQAGNVRAVVPMPGSFARVRHYLAGPRRPTKRR